MRTRNRERKEREKEREDGRQSNPARIRQRKRVASGAEIFLRFGSKKMLNKDTGAKEREAGNR